MRILVFVALAFIGSVVLSGCANRTGPTEDAQAQGVAAETAEQEGDGSVSAAQPPTRTGLFGFLLRDEASEAEAPIEATATLERKNDADDLTLSTAETEPATAPEPTEIAIESDSPGRGLFGRLFGGGRAGDANADTTTPFGAANAAIAPTAPADGIAPGTVLPFGQVATVCGLSRRELGAAVDQFPRDGRTRWQLHDPAEGGIDLRTHYITGFRDRCARQVTGALVLFGNADVHETTRYADTNTRPYTTTDDAYEAIKSRLCGVRPRVPCPADRYDRLSEAVSFVTIYARFGATEEWYELLLVNGELEAAAMSGL